MVSPGKKIAKELEVQALSALNKGYAEFKKRVFFSGHDIDGQPIGKYSRRPFYKSVRQQGKGYAGAEGSQVTNAGMKPRGKPKAGKKRYVYGDFKNGKPRKSMYFAEGYYEYRKTVKRKNETVDLALTNQLNNDIRTGKRSGYFVVEITTPLSVTKARGNEARFKKRIFEFSETEAKIVEDAIQKAADKAIENLTK